MPEPLLPKITAPFTPDQVTALNAFQTAGWMHPFTCGREHATHQVLYATANGWRCSDRACDYRQDWAHAFMAEPIRCPECGEPYRRVLGGHSCTHLTDCGEPWRPGEIVHADPALRIADAPAPYPRPDGDVIALGPGVFASLDGQTISWKGENYTRQPAPSPRAVAADGTLREAIAEALREADREFRGADRSDYVEAAAIAAEEHYAAEQERYEETVVGDLNQKVINLTRRAEKAEAEVKRLGLMIDEYGTGASQLADKIQRVRELHVEGNHYPNGGSGAWTACADCSKPWPCPTVRALTPKGA